MVSLQELKQRLKEVFQETAPGQKIGDDNTAQGLWLLAQSNYDIRFPPDQELSEKIIFPVTPIQSNGIEDVRLTAHRDEGGKTVYYATCTALEDGRGEPSNTSVAWIKSGCTVTLSGDGPPPACADRDHRPGW